MAAAALRSDTTCSHDGMNYTNGQEVYFEKACKKCPCDADFTDENGLGCKPLDCGIDYRCVYRAFRLVVRKPCYSLKQIT